MKKKSVRRSQPPAETITISVTINVDRMMKKLRSSQGKELLNFFHEALHQAGSDVIRDIF